MSLRGYQKKSVRAAVKQNTIVLLPTGAGKTKVGAEVIREIGWPSIFIVPKTFLVAQQASAIREHLKSAEGGDSTKPSVLVAELTGGKALTAFDILVCTPAALLNVESSIQWPRIRCIVFDECHHARKDDPYAKIAELVEKKICPRVVGLTALMAYNSDEQKIREECSELCRLLRIESIVKFDSEELFMDGFTGHKGRTDEVHCYDDSLVPRRPTDQPWRSLRDDVLSGDLAKSTREERAIVRTTFFIEACLEDALAAEKGLLQAACPGFVDTLNRPVATFEGLREMVPLAEWGKYAKACYEELELHPEQYLQAGLSAKTAMDLARALPYWYEAFRIAAVSDPDGSDIAAMFLRMVQVKGEMDVSSLLKKIQESPRSLEILDQGTIDYLPRMLDDRADVESNESYRLHHLREKLRECIDKSQQTSSEFQGIIFVEHRVAAHVLDWWINRHLSASLGLSSTALFAVKTPATFNIRLSKQDMKDRLESFREGKARLLVTTTVAEEGMDVPEANHVIRFDRVKNAVSQVQGKGRAREEGSKHIHLANDETQVNVQALAVSYNEIFAALFRPEKLRGYDSSLADRINQHLSNTPQRSTHQLAGVAATGKNPISLVNEWLAKRKEYSLSESCSNGGSAFIVTAQLMKDDVLVCRATGAPCRSKQDSKLSAYEKLWNFIEPGRESPQVPQVASSLEPSPEPTLDRGAAYPISGIAPPSASQSIAAAVPVVPTQSTGTGKNAVTMVKEWMDKHPGYKLDESYDNQLAPPFVCTLKLTRIADNAVVAEASGSPKTRKQEAKAASAEVLFTHPFFSVR
jgi:ERCC4-related helicase